MPTYIKFLLKLFLSSFLNIFLIFFFITIIISLLEQFDFFKEANFTFSYLIFLSFLNAPSIIFEILPFIFLISTQVFFIKLIDSNELEIFKYSGLNNFNIIKHIGIFSFILSLFLMIFFYNLSSLMKSGYLEIKNRYSSDQKYLAVVTENGFWIKDEIDTKINIINAGMIDGQYLTNVVITQFDENYNFLRTLQSPKVDISSTKWEMLNVKISMNGETGKQDKLQFLSSFDLKKINSLFSNLSSLTIYDLIKLKNIYKSLNYSTVDLDSHLLKITMYPIYLTLITILSAIIMFSIGYKKNTLYKIILGIFLSVVIYYINYFFNVLGTTEKIPVLLSIIFPLILLAIISTISIIRLNEK